MTASNGNRIVIALCAGAVVVSAGLPNALASTDDVTPTAVAPSATTHPAEVDWNVKTSIALELGEAWVLLLGNEALVAGNPASGQDEMFVVETDTMTVEKRLSSSGLLPTAVLNGKAYGATRTGLGYYDPATGAVSRNDSLCGAGGRARDAAAIGELIYLSCDSVVVEVDPVTLNELRRVNLGGWLGRVAVYEDYMFVPSYFNGLYKVDMRSFAQVGAPFCYDDYACGEHWRTYTEGANVLSVGLHRVFRYAPSGAYLSSHPSPEERYGSYFSATSEHGVVTSGTTEGVLTLFDWETGSAVWSRDLGPGTSGVATSGSSFFVFSRDGKFTRYGKSSDTPPVPPAPAAPDQPAAMPSGSSVVVTWRAVPGVESYRVEVSPGAFSCLTVETVCTVSGLTPGVRYGVQVFSVADGMESSGSPVASFTAGDPPGAVSQVGVSPGNGSAVVSWQAPVTDGGSPVTGYRVVSVPGGLSCVAGVSERSCEVTGLTNGVPYLFMVYAVNSVGEGPGVVSAEAVAFTWPSAPPNVRVGVKASSSAEVRWDTSASNGSPVSGYVLNVSRDNGISWSETSVGNVTRANVPGLTGPAQAAWVQVAAVNLGGQGPYSDAVLVTTTGVAPSVRVSVLDADGVPVKGGAITWAMANGAASSSKTYGLTESGLIEFPLAPAGAVNVTLTGALTSSGATVSGTFRGHLGFTSTVLRLPEAPVSMRTVTVRLPNGLPVPGVSVESDPGAGQYQDSDCLEWAIGDLSEADYCLEGRYGPPSLRGGFKYSTDVEGFVFTVPRQTQTVTDGQGQILLTGFTEGQPRVDIAYDDGLVRQAKSVVLRGVTTDVELDYMPVIQVASDSLQADFGEPVQIPVRVISTTTSQSSGTSLRSGAGIKVTVLPPAGAPKGTCRRTPTAVTNANGRASLTVCATKSGMYRFKAQGAAAVDSVLVQVRGAAPMPPTAVTVSSLRVGTAKATWNPPIYDGGSRVTGYVITSSAKGQRTISRNVPASTRAVTLKGLSNATMYQVRIQARTSQGLSDAVFVSVPVA